MTPYEQGIEAAARAGEQFHSPDIEITDEVWEIIKHNHPAEYDGMLAEARAKVEAFLSVQPTLTWCEPHRMSTIPDIESACEYGAYWGLPCSIIEQKRVST